MFPFYAVRPVCWVALNNEICWKHKRHIRYFCCVRGMFTNTHYTGLYDGQRVPQILLMCTYFPVLHSWHVLLYLWWSSQNDFIMNAMASQIASLTIVYSTDYSRRKENIKAPRHWPTCGKFTGHVWWIHRWPLNISHKEPVTRKMFPFNDAIMWMSLTVNEP